MLRCASTFILACALALPAAAQVQRNFTAKALRGEVVFGTPPEVTLNGKPARLAPGARIRDENNLLLMSGALVGRKLVVNYTTELEGMLLDVWILSRSEMDAQALARHRAGGAGLAVQRRRADLDQAMNAPTAKKVFIRSFGCQMNDYDSAKMADVLHAAEGYEPTQDVEQADLILFNTCSIREKAQEKVFSDLGRVKHLKDKGVLIGVGGCVASQEGAALIERAPYVDLVFGPQTLHRLPQLIAQRRAQQRPQVDISFPEIEKFDHLPPARVDGPMRLRLDHGRLLEVLLLLRGALHPRRGGQPPLRRRAGRGGRIWPTRACARSRCWGRTSMPTAARWAARRRSPTSHC